MNTVKVDNKETKMIAHRGLSKIEAENTASAFVAAGNRSYFGIETDIHVTVDGKFVAIHDEVTSRVSKQNINVEEVPYEITREILLNSAYGSGRGDLIIPSLEEYISICKRYDKKCVLELKNKFESQYIKKLVKEISDMEYLENVIFISFCIDNLIELRELLPGQPIQYLCGNFNDDLVDMLNRYSFDLDIFYKELNKEKIDLVHKNNHKVNCWTVDDKKDAEKLIEWGVDYITTNILE